ncbi:MAG: recombination protein RecR [Parcubacteria group bacterium CG1_02_37_51]|uniref:Recombination protein RecR n=2 Tax=Candidatus Komeiliibacteriota TaxID=1817908 RepID=A0A2M7RDJ5_9BACT|nr:MAG: recombination protein RecR [Parcubacteria group bacterium CG1_02_37_51]PIY94805.1 MAG: recombination protein RecR [Candidatus Komeilibacteria bacterium CG_4_10_14_0_8_um_filter_37_78]
MSLPKSLQKLIAQFDKLPGIGPKTSEKLVFHLLNRPKEDLKEFADSLLDAKEQITICSVCFNFSDSIPCSICKDSNRDKETLCVVAETQDVQAIEKTNNYQGLYHVLQGTINPPENITPDKLKIKELQQRIKKDQPNELILALNNDIAGETTSLYLIKLLQDSNINISRLAKGLPSGSEIEYADDITLGYALKDRKKI